MWCKAPTLSPEPAARSKREDEGQTHEHRNHRPIERRAREGAIAGCYAAYMAIVFAVLVALFGAKLAWNISVPLWLERGKGVSLHANIEIALLVAMMLVADRPTLVAVVGVCAIACSYAGAFGLGIVLGWRYHRGR